ncbi:MAG TPA: prepilin peptidase [Planctomycetaceae bacterium]|nr:prepilin peptidase [Planctomycetaceae bacterium]
MSVLVAALAFVIGSAFGSFLNVVIDRVPSGQSIVRPPSRCPSCSTQLRPLDLVPVASYLWLRGRCRYCRTSIPIRLMLVELAAGLGFLGIYLWSGLNPGWLALAGTGAVLLATGVASVARRR